MDGVARPGEDGPMSAWPLIAILAASGEPVTFLDPVSVLGRPRSLTQRGSDACSLHFQLRDPTWGWIDYAPGADVIESYEVEAMATVVPDHDSPLFNTDFWCWGVVHREVRLRGDWRIVDGEGHELTRFVGPYAVDARPLARRLGATRDWRRGRRDAACERTADHACWTALEPWLYLEDWKDARCGASGG